MNPSLTPSQFVEQMLKNIKDQFYGDNEKEFYQDRQILMKSLVEPAQYLNSRGVRISLERQREILLDIFMTIKRHGNTAKVHRFSAYLLHCVQSHLLHQGDKYYDEGKRTRDAISDVMFGLKQKSEAPADPGGSVDQLAALSALLRSKGGRKKKKTKPAAALQADLFGDSKALK
jgi:hypothetical protein